MFIAIQHKPLDAIGRIAGTIILYIARMKNVSGAYAPGLLHGATDDPIARG